MKYKSRKDFVIQNINKYKNKNHKNFYLDIGFIGENNEPFMHYNILKTLGPDDYLFGINIFSPVDNILNN